MGVTQPNRTGKSSATDVIYTNPITAQWVVDYYKPTGLCLEPCAGMNAFYNALPEPKVRLEIADGLDFFDYKTKVDWIITNPPYSIFDEFLTHAFEIADNVVFFCPLQKVFKSQKIDKEIQKFGGIKEIVMMGTGGQHGFPVGFPVGCIHYQRGYDSEVVKITRQYDVLKKPDDIDDTLFEFGK
jgi:hypothetical protein